MKKNVLALAVIISAGTLLITGCSKEDTTAPVITIIGDNPYDLELRKTYVDQGATATDDEDGNLTSSIITNDGDVNNKLPGDYEVTYSVSDAAGNIGTDSRLVNVYATNVALAASYQVHDDCGGGVVFDYAQTVGTGSSNKITFNKFADYSNNGSIYATIDADGTITLPSQTATGIGSLVETHTFQGSGQVTETGFTITYTDINVTGGGATATCTSTYTRN